MTVSSQTNRVTYVGNGSSTAFSVSFPFQSANDLVVVETIIATGVQTTKTITTHYTVSGTPDSLGYYPNGGTVTAVTAPASTVRWTIYRAPALLQTLNLAENNALPAESLEAQLDYLTMLVQRLNDRVNRSVRQPDGDSADLAVMPSKVDRASKYMAYDAAGDPIASNGTTEANPVSAFMATVLDDTTAAAAAATLAVLPLSGGTLTGGLVTNSNISSTRTAVTGYTRVTPNFCKAITPIVAAYTPSATCAGHVLDANLPTNTLVLMKINWATKSNNSAGARLGLTTFSGSSNVCALTLSSSTFSCYEQAAVAAGTVIAQGSDIILTTTLAGTVYGTDLNAGGNGTSYIVSIESLGYFD